MDSMNWLLSQPLSRQLKIVKMARQMVRWEVASSYVEAVGLIHNHLRGM